MTLMILLWVCFSISVGLMLVIVTLLIMGAEEDCPDRYEAPLAGMVVFFGIFFVCAGLLLMAIQGEKRAELRENTKCKIEEGLK